jgi:hypothetical protein
MDGLMQAERQVLEQLGDEGWRTPAELAAEIPLPEPLIRTSIKALSGRRLVERGGWGDTMRWGEWKITAAGLDELHDPQLQIGMER